MIRGMARDGCLTAALAFPVRSKHCYVNGLCFSPTKPLPYYLTSSSFLLPLREYNCLRPLAISRVREPIDSIIHEQTVIAG